MRSTQRTTRTRRAIRRFSMVGDKVVLVLLESSRTKSLLIGLMFQGTWGLNCFETSDR